MDLILLGNKINEAASNIDAGRKGLATKGKAEEGLISYEIGISETMLAFQEAQISNDPLALLFSEYTFVTQEFHLCGKDDTHTINSLTKAIMFFKDALLALKVVENKPVYKEVENTYPHYKDYRFKGFPKDALSEYLDKASYPSRNIIREELKKAS